MSSVWNSGEGDMRHLIRVIAIAASVLAVDDTRAQTRASGGQILVREITTHRQAEHASGDPVIQLPSPTGQHRVGRMSFYALDASRGETMTPLDSTDKRALVFHVWYPTREASGSLASFIEVWPEDTVFRRSYSFMGVDLLPRVRSHALAEPRVSDAARTYPVILFSHGLGAISRLYTSFLENLASQGYIVVGVDHSYFSSAFKMPDGRTMRNLSRAANRQRDVIAQAGDLSFVVNALEQLQRSAPATRLARRMDLGRLGVFGHSRGGFATPHACRYDRRFKACLNLDGYSMTPAVMDSGITQPYMHIEEIAPWDPPLTDSQLAAARGTRAEASAEAVRDSTMRDATFSRMASGTHLVVIAGAVHNSFSNIAFIAPHRFPSATHDFRRTLEITDAYLLAFFDQYLRGKSSPLLEPKKSPYPEVTLAIYRPGAPRQVFRGTPSVVGTPPEPDVVRGEAGRRMDRYLQSAQNFGFSGAVLVADRDGIVLRKGYGPADERRRVSSNMLFDMGSITKQFTAAGILLLESEGRIATTDSLAKFFPNAPADKRGITIHQMLTHTSGIISDFADDYAQVSRDSAVRAILNGPLVAPPGRQFSYSNAAFSMLAMIIEQITGQKYDRFMEERIFRPVGMRHTGYAIANLDSGLVARSYTPPVDHGTPAQRLNRAGGPGWNLKGNGGLLTTVDDLYRYDRALGAGQPISKAIQARQFAPQFHRSPTLAHGYDWWIDATDDGIVFSRAGDGPPTGVSAEYRKYARDSTVFILLANNRHNGGSTRRYVMPNLRRLFLGTMTIELPVVRGGSAAELQAVAGRYQVDSTSYFTVERAGDHLALSAIGQPAVNVMVFNRDTLSIRGRERMNQRATDLVRALAVEDTSALRVAFGAQANLAKPLGWWRGVATRLGGFKGARVLGTARLDRGVFMSTVRLCFRDSTMTVRWVLPGAVPTLSSEDAYLPGAFDFGAVSPVAAGAWSPYWWMAGKDSLVTYDMAYNRTLHAMIIRRPDGAPSELVFKVPNGDVRAVRIAGGEEGRIHLLCPFQS